MLMKKYNLAHFLSFLKNRFPRGRAFPYEATNAGNKVTADLEDFAARIAIGYKF